MRKEKRSDEQTRGKVEGRGRSEEKEISEEDGEGWPGERLRFIVPLVLEEMGGEEIKEEIHGKLDAIDFLPGHFIKDKY